MAACALFRDEDGRVLLVDPTYKPTWDLPGGRQRIDLPSVVDTDRQTGKTGHMTDAGYRFVTVSELLTASAPDGVGGPPSRSAPA